MSDRVQVPMTAAELIQVLGGLPPKTPVFHEAFDLRTCRSALLPVEEASYWPDEGGLSEGDPAGVWLA